jgi:hypothetical protein
MPVHAAAPVAVLVRTDAAQVTGEGRTWWTLALLGRDHLAKLARWLARLRSNVERPGELEYLVP